LSLSATTSTINLDSISLTYLPPHPPQGSGIHRYAYVLLEQPQEKVEPNENDLTRENFNLRDFIAKHEMKPAGLHTFRTQWSPAVSQYYKDVLSEFNLLYVCIMLKYAFEDVKEPRFGRMPKVDMYKLLADRTSV